jgi:hypothetical protein
MSMATPRDQEAYDALAFDTLARGDLAFLHQHVVDAFAAQYADATTKPITIAFALVGLYLHIERGTSGRDAQRVHMLLARRRRQWPTFRLPDRRGSITVHDVLAAPPGRERDAAIERWCASVWDAWKDQRAAVVALLQD